MSGEERRQSVTNTSHVNRQPDKEKEVALQQYAQGLYFVQK